MWQIATWSPAHSSAVSVVPMPSVAGSASLISCSVDLAEATASASASSMSALSVRPWPSSGAMAEIATALATSPAACPPMPSAMASSRGPA